MEVAELTNTSSSGARIACIESGPAMLIFTIFSITNVFFIPLFALVLHTGVQRCTTRRSASTHTSPSDIFTYNLVVLELVSLVGCFSYCCGGFINVPGLTRFGEGIFSFTSLGQSLIHVLTCVERYIAVVHPVRYRSLRRARWLRVIGTGGVWLLCVATFGYSEAFTPWVVVITMCCFIFVYLLIVAFCSVSVLLVLLRPGPGAGGNQTKRKAFQTITMAMGVLWLRFVGVVVGALMGWASPTDVTCIVGFSMAFLTIPGSLVLPVLFLLRAGKAAKN